MMSVRASMCRRSQATKCSPDGVCSCPEVKAGARETEPIGALDSADATVQSSITGGSISVSDKVAADAAPGATSRSDASPLSPVGWLADEDRVAGEGALLGTDARFVASPASWTTVTVPVNDGGRSSP